MNANAKFKIIRVGRYFFDKSLQEDGYGVEDIFGADDAVIELPELLDASKRRAMGWLMCPNCGERSQIERQHPACPACGWSEEDCGIEGVLRCAA